MEVVAAGLLFFDRMAYIYSGDTSQTGFIMVRLSNFMVFFLTSGIVFAYNLYSMGLFESYVKIDKTPLRMKIVTVISLVGMLMSIISQFTNLYYYFDEANRYHRGQGFIISYIIPIICPFSRFIFIALTVYVALPITMGIIQVFAYGVSIVNMAMVLVSISLYVFTYLDINDEVERAHKVDLENANEEMSNMKRLFEQTTTAFVDAVEKRDPLSKGHSLRVAKLAKQLAQENGKSEEECDEVYYTALLHNVGMVSISDRILEKGTDLTEEESEEFRKQPVVSSDILSGITVFPYLSRGARYVSERYDGSGYPDGLKGEDIPEVSRILAIADVYDGMKTESRSSEPLPDPIIREEFIEGSGTKYDPQYAELIIHMIDSEIAGKKKKHSAVLEKEITCGAYRDTISSGIQVLQSVSKISFKCECEEERAGFFSAPSIILFDSYDSCVHSSDRSIEAYHYVEYCEVWFDGHIVSTRARNTSVDVKEKEEASGQTAGKSGEYVIMAAKYEDHIRLVMESPTHTAEIIVALPNELYEDKEKLKRVCDDLVKEITQGKPFDYEYAVHWNKAHTNLHLHFMWSERENVLEREPKVYAKDIWQDKETHKLAKANAEGAELVHRKGEVQKDKDGNIKYKDEPFKAKDVRFKNRSFVQEKNKIISQTLAKYGFNLRVQTKDSPYLSQKKEYKGASQDYIENCRAAYIYSAKGKDRECGQVRE